MKSIATDPFQLNEAIEVLRRYSLIKRNAEAKTLNMHRLVQVVLKDGMDKKTQRRWAQRTVKVVNAAFPHVEYRTWPRCQACLPHALACAALIEQHKFTFPEAAQLLGQVGWYLREHALYTQAEALLQQALAIIEKVLGPDHPDTARTLGNLAGLYEAQGKHEQAEPLYQRALAIKEKVLDPDHPSIANILENYAGLLRQMQRNEEAARLEQRAQAIRARRSS